jgi:hypothetical protein
LTAAIEARYKRQRRSSLAARSMLGPAGKVK